jgi:hypothetical protein
LNIIGHPYQQTPAAVSTDFHRQKRRIALASPMARPRQTPAAQTVLPVLPPVPGWARSGAVTDMEAAFQAGAALAALDARVRGCEIPASHPIL